MELKECIAETLIQIAQGVYCAKDKYKELGGRIAPAKTCIDISNMSQKKNPLLNIVEFEVVLAQSSSNSDSKGIGVKLSIINGVAGKGNESKDESVTKVKFSVPVNLPFD